ncbi:phosphate/phosphite/phosphonate ABC transporter substrate-binding protein [Neomegalonema perideroedes]|uniref:phosphate/phosphite/phosphonate ABC transporter substrate-binding protein n=1 Tax=Neomegalonema perideroedes TaxID=217219 RepID=UPI00036DB121|nr:PhnD/SsuA/transferrin family substrate-binding protein [Neomegalonema perideroedes]
MSSEAIKVGAVIYDPKVTVIWGIIADFFRREGLETQCEFYSDYKSQVDGLFAGEIDVAWNSPLAWADCHLRGEGRCLYGAMRDTDRDRKTYILARKNGGPTSLAELKGKTVGLGASDSPQARLIPINLLRRHGLEFGRDYVEKRFDVGVGLHGDHVGGELDAVKALQAGEVDAAAALDLNVEAWRKDGTLDANQIAVIAATPEFDHCIFVGRPDLQPERFERWMEVLNRMDYKNPDHKTMMDMEGLKAWVPGRTSGFAQLQEACDYLKFFGASAGKS